MSDLEIRDNVIFNNTGAGVKPDSDPVRLALKLFVALLEGQTEPMHPITWQVDLAKAKAALAADEKHR